MPRKATGRPNGRPRGRKSASTIERERKQTEAKALAFGKMTEAEAAQLLPRDIFRLVAVAAILAGDHKLMLEVAAKWGPYEHPTKSESTVALTLTDVRRLADLARAEASRRGLDFDDPTGPAAGTLPH